MDKKQTLIAVGAALAGALSLHIYLDRYELEVAGGRPQQVVMVTRDLALGETITEGAITLRKLPEQYVEERHVLANQLERVIGTRVTSQVASGATLLWSDLDVMQSSRTLSGLIRAGMRAFTLPGGDVDFDGLLRPGDRVDVLFTKEQNGSETRTLLQNILVLTVGSDLGHTDSNEVSTHFRSGGGVTLSLSVEQAQLLAHTQGKGTLRLALRNPQDMVLAEGVEPTRDVTPHAATTPEASHGR